MALVRLYIFVIVATQPYIITLSQSPELWHLHYHAIKATLIEVNICPNRNTVIIGALIYERTSLKFALPSGI